jgi:serine/threonine kinase PknH
LHNIRSASVFVFALSDESLHSKPCRAELDYARKLDRPVPPVKVGPVANFRSSTVADFQTINFQLHNALFAFEIMAAIDEKALELKPPAGQLPTPPPIPYAYLLAFGRQIDSTEFDQAEQTTVVDQLHRAITEETDESVRRDVLAMLRTLMSKPWSTKRTEIAARVIIRTATSTPDQESVDEEPGGRADPTHG